MKKYVGGLLIAAIMTSAQAFDVKDWSYVNQLNWIKVDKISKIETYKVGNNEVLYFYHLSGGKEFSNQINSTANPVMHSLFFTAYLTGAAIEFKRGSGKEGSEILAARLAH